MAAFMDESGVGARIGHSPIGEASRPHFIAITSPQGPFPPLPFSTHQIRHPLTEQSWLAGNCNVYPARTSIDACVMRGGGADMG
jgi:hypothetical protein